MSWRWSVVHPVRLVAALLLAGAVALGTYQVLKPRTFSYIKMRDGVAAEGGDLIKPEMVEEGVLTVGGLTAPAGSPLPGLLAWTDAARYVGLPLARRVQGGAPLFAGDVDVQDKGTMDREIGPGKTGMTIPADNVVGVTPHLAPGDRVHVYVSFEDQEGGHSGLLLREMPVIAVQRNIDQDVPVLAAVTIALTTREAVLLTQALTYGKVRLGKASVQDRRGAGVGDESFAAALLKTRIRDGGKGERP